MEKGFITATIYLNDLEKSMATQSETDMENEWVQFLSTKMGYQPVRLSDEASLVQNLRCQLQTLNQLNDAPFTDAEFKQVLNYLTKSITVFERATQLRDKYPLRRDDGTIKHIEFISNHTTKNQFQVTHQYLNKHQGNRKTRFDVTILINGLPLIHIELKKRGNAIKEAFNQIQRYHRDSFRLGGGFFLFTQIFIISNGVNTKYYANNQDFKFEQTFHWASIDNHPINNLTEFTRNFLTHDHIIRMINHYIVLNQTGQYLMVMRPYQIHACNAIVQQVEKGEQNGYIWHSTGSGKTLTSFKTSQILMNQPNIDKIIFVVDRKDLDYQTAKEFNKFEKDSVDLTENTQSLIHQLKDPNKKLVLTTLQKLNKAINSNKNKKQLEHIQQKRIIFIFDECHRSQFGKSHRSIVDFFKNTQLFGFTGTPILDENINKSKGIEKTTASLFDQCLHKYVILDAIRDGNILKFSIEYIGQFFVKNSAEEYKDPITKKMLDDPKRLETIANYILDHHRQKTVRSSFNAIFCISGRTVLIQYYLLLQKLQKKRLELDVNYKPLKIATIFSYSANEAVDNDDMLNDDIDTPSKHFQINQSSRDYLEKFVQDYNQLFNCKEHINDAKGFNSYYQDISRRIKNKQIDILLVVNMFLTGFDSKYLNSLYVDKNLRYHGLIQAFSRTNRILNNNKSQGNIVCFRDLKEKTDKAITLFSNKNAKEIILTPPYDDFKNQFEEHIQKLQEIAPNVQSVDDLITDEQKKQFATVFRDILRTLNIMQSFVDYNEKDTIIGEQAINDYASKYLDIHDSVRQINHDDNNPLIEFDFEASLTQRDDISIGYILTLLKQTANLPEHEKVIQQNKIVNMMEHDLIFRPKVSLIQGFIRNNFSQIQQEEDIETQFFHYLNTEKKMEIHQLCQQGGLKEEQTSALLEDSLASNQPIRADQIHQIFEVQPGILERQTAIADITNRISSFLERFRSL